MDKLHYGAMKKNMMVTVAFEHAIVEKIFEECKTQHTAFGVEYTCKIPTFFNIINKSEKLGIPRDKLYDVYICYFKMCDPGRKGTISIDPRSLPDNTQKIVDSLDIETEQKSLQKVLLKVVRHPGQSLEISIACTSIW